MRQGPVESLKLAIGRVGQCTDPGNQSCLEASIPDLAVRIIRLFEELKSWLLGI
jgi:hypothetical protein